MSAVRAPEKRQKSRSANAPGGTDAYSASAASAPRHIPPYLCIPCGQVSQSSLGGVNSLERSKYFRSIPCEWVYYFAQSGRQAEIPGYLKPEAVALASEPLPLGPPPGLAIPMAEVRTMTFNL